MYHHELKTPIALDPGVCRRSEGRDFNDDPESMRVLLRGDHGRGIQDE